MEKTTKEFKEYILEKLQYLEEMTCKPMMGEYLLYYKGILFGGIYNNRVLIKKTENNSTFGLTEEIPYKNAKPMYFLKDLDNEEKIKEMILKTCEDLKGRK